MPMNTTYLNALATHARSLITHIALVDGSGAEVSTRMAVTWTAASGGLIRPTGDLVFTMEAGDEVAGWSGFSASSRVPPRRIVR